MRYEPTIDAQNQPDWNMYLTPGPKAYAEFAAAHGKRRAAKTINESEVQDQQSRRRQFAPHERRSKLEPVAPSATIDPTHVAEFLNRGVTEKKARELLLHLKPGQDALAQLELGDQLMNKNPGKYTNPSGFYIHLVEENTPLPKGFETKAQKKKREAEEQRRGDERRAQLELEAEYEWYRDAEIDRFIAALDPAEIGIIREAKREEMATKYQNAWIIDKFSESETRHELAKRVPLMTIDEFKIKREQGSVPSAQNPDPFIEDIDPDEFVVSPHEETAVDRPATSPSTGTHPAAGERREPTREVQDVARNLSASEPSTSQPLKIQLVAQPPQEVAGTESIEPNAA